MIPPTIIVGVGGQGGYIASLVRDRLRANADETDDPDTMRALIDRYLRFFALDTTQTPWHSSIGAGNVYVLAPRTPDQVIRSLKQQPGFFNDWWPAHIDSVGDYYAGAGGLRVKGRLAYWLQGKEIATNISKQLAELRTIWRSSIGVATAPLQPALVFVVGSVAGGTGSGILLSLAMHLRRALANETVQIVGAIPLASIMEGGPAAFAAGYVWGNASAALREIDWWQVPSGMRVTEIKPFFPMHGSVAVDGDAQEKPFDLVYLFGRSNRDGKTLPDFQSYSRLIADCIALDINSPIADANQSSFSNFIGMGLGPQRYVMTEGGPRSTAYGSVSAASINLPVHDISRFLAIGTVTRLLDRDFLSPTIQDEAASDWVAGNGLDQRGNKDDLVKDLLLPNAPARGATLPKPPSVANQLETAAKADVKSLVTRIKGQVDGPWAKEFGEYLEVRSDVVLAERRAAVDGRILGFLNGSQPDGFELALEFAGALDRVLVGMLDQVKLSLNGNGGSVLGKRKALDKKEDQFKDRPANSAQRGDLQALVEGVSSRGFPPGARAKAAREQFVQNWWNPFIDLKRSIMVEERVIWIYEQLLTSLRHTAAVLEAIRAALSDRRDVLANESQSVLGSDKSGGSLVLEDRVLDDRLLVEQAFSADTDEVMAASGALAAQLIGDLQRIITDLEADPPINAHARTTRVRTHAAAAVERALASCADDYAKRVRRLTIWDALIREYHLRLETKHMDELLLSTGGKMELRTYVQQRVEQVIARATPFWSLDVPTLAAHPNLTLPHDGGVYYSEDAVDQASDTLPTLADDIKAIATAAQIAAQPGTYSRHRVVVSRREAGAPLFALDSHEIQTMESKEAYVSASFGAANFHLYLDERFSRSLPSSLRIAAAMQAREEALVLAGLAMQVGAMRFGTRSDGRPDYESVQIVADAEGDRWKDLAPGMVQAIQKLTTQRTNRELLEKAIAVRFDQLRGDQHSQVYDDARVWAAEERDQPAAARPGSADDRRRLYGDMVNAIADAKKRVLGG